MHPNICSGYGDMSPATVHAKLFTMFMSLYGIVILGIFLGVAGELVVEIHNRGAEKRQARARAAVAVAKSTRNANEQEGAGDDAAEPTLLQDIRSIVIMEFPIMVVLLLVGLCVGHVEGWSVLDSVWWLVVRSAPFSLAHVMLAHTSRYRLDHDYYPSRSVVVLSVSGIIIRPIPPRVSFVSSFCPCW